MKKTALLIVLILSVAPILPAQSEALKDRMNTTMQDKEDLQAEQLLNTLMQALLIEDFDVSAKAAFGLTHKSNYNLDHTALSRDLLDFSFKKAHSNAKFYQVPVKITRVQELKMTEIGHPRYNSYEKGSERKYWVAKKPGINGMPAPVAVFFPADGSEPKISYMGSL